MKIWIHKNEDGLRKYLQPDTDIRYIEDEEISDAGVVLIRSDDPLGERIKNGIIVEYYDKDLDKIRQLANKRLASNYEYYELQYQLNKKDEFDTVVVGSSYALFGLDMKLLPSWRNLAL